MKNYLTIVSCVVLGSNVRAAVDPQTSLGFITGGGYPAHIKISELGAGYHAFRLHIVGESGGSSIGGLSSLMMIGMMASQRSGNPSAMMGPMMQTQGLADQYWSDGQTVNFGGHEFLVTYKLSSGLSAASLASQQPKFSASLNLNLVRMDQIGSIAPDPTFTPDSLRNVLKASNVTFDEEPLQTNSGGTATDAITSAILVPVLAQARIAAEATSTLSNAKQLGLAMLIYSNDYDDVFPYVESTPQLKKVVLPYIKNEGIWATYNPNKSEFRFNMNLAGVSATSVDDPARIPIIYESKAWPDGRRIVTFVDGHAKRVTAAEWASDVQPQLSKHFPRTAKKPIKS